ncbi:MAG: hypothetical protein COA79_16000 [Planctomycetota bacterium]|nr:MAG: hypothetical protein COA79_16000 [Planctomycetota bacterium]
MHTPAQLSIGELVAFVLMQNKLFDPLNKLADMQTVVSEASASIERIYEVFDTAPSIKNKKKALKPISLNGHIELKNLTFTYHENDDENPAIINNISLQILPKQKVAFVGPSGSGKSTLIHLLTRFYDVNQGQINIDGVNIKDYHLRKLRKRISIVPQEPMLFSSSIYENIAFAKIDATPSEVFMAAKQAYADEFINKLPNGYETTIGEKGCRLSGGQKQRIAIARAFLRNPSILILDEATSSLDNESEFLVQKALNELMKNKTTITIAHRLSTIENSDVIFYFDDGELIEKGSHQELLQQKGYYYNLVNTHKKMNIFNA